MAKQMELQVRTLRTPTPPLWLAMIGFDQQLSSSEALCHDDEIEIAGDWVFARVRVAADTWNDWYAIHDRVQAAYDRMRNLLVASGNPSPVRFWNYVPDLLRPVRNDQSVYQCFNGARHEAFKDWFGTQDITRQVVAASAVASCDNTLHLQALAHRSKPVAIENPRQRPAYRYSPRYGEVPPSFARATLVPDETHSSAMIITAGTASVRGEDSVHHGNLTGQLQETETNLASLVTAAATDGDSPGYAGSDSALVEINKAYGHVRAYVVRRSDEPLVVHFLRERFIGATSMEIVHAQLCRPELLVEVEAMGHLRWKTLREKAR